MPLLIRGPTSQAAPSEYTLAPREAFIPESVTATFNGAGAAGAFLPTLSIYAQSGELLARSPATEVAAGSSAEVTFAPLLRAASGAAAASEIPTAIDGFSSDSVVSDAAFHNQAFDPTVFLTNDPTRYTCATVAGRTGLIIHTVGTYMGWFSIHLFDTPGFRVANPETFTARADIAGGCTPFGPRLILPTNTGVLDNGVGGSSWFLGWGEPFAVDAANVAANSPIVIQVQQATGQTLDTEPTFFVQWVSDDTFGF